MNNDTEYGPDPGHPTGRRWQHSTVTLGGTDKGAFEQYTQDQEHYVLSQGGLGWELVGVTTLHNGWLMFAFKREWLGEAGEPAHVGTYI